MPTSVRATRLISLGAAMILTAHAEHALAVAVGFNPVLAWLFPVMLDLYAVSAFRAHARRDIGAAIVLMIVCQVLAHLLTAGMVVPAWWLVIPVSAVAPIVLWRGHHLTTITPAPVADPAPTPAAPVASIVELAPVPVPVVAAPQASPPQRPGKAPDARRAELAALITREPAITQAAAAAALGITDRQVRNIVGGWATFRAATLTTA
ncbi:hypothetical protein [Stackebrandtia soli]|uniref:hypothetical protein n=1 Tax=Stackebrandtia soli TaxID=1892856 RepID=UPI0039E998FD